MMVYHVIYIDFLQTMGKQDSFLGNKHFLALKNKQTTYLS